MATRKPRASTPYLNTGKLPMKISTTVAKKDNTGTGMGKKPVTGGDTTRKMHMLKRSGLLIHKKLPKRK